MTCIAGTVEDPAHWIRFRSGLAVELEGRICERQQPFTNRRTCSSCPAYRGVRWDTSEATGVAPNGDPLGLRPDEYAEYETALDATFDDDFDLIEDWKTRMAGGIGHRALRDIGDPAEMERWAAYMQAYRSTQTDDQKEAQREATRERVRRFRMKRKQCQASEK